MYYEFHARRDLMPRAVVLAVLAVLFAASQAQADFYKWTDRAGREFYTNDREKVPAEYRHTLIPVEVHDERVTIGGKPQPGAPQQAKAAEHRDRNGRGEEYWRRRTENLKRQMRLQQDELDLLAREDRDEEGATAMRSAAGRTKSQKARDRKRAKIEKMLARLRHELEVELPEEARKADAYPGWVR
jgi:hypothetical protein